MNGGSAGKRRVRDINIKRLGKELIFSEAFGVFRHISAIFRVFCLVIFGNFVYLHTVKGVDDISHPIQINANEL